MRFQSLFFLVSLLVLQANAEEKDDVASSEALIMATDYLRKFGWAPETRIGDPSEQLSGEGFKESIRAFQKFAGLAETGELDAETIAKMKVRRCGNKDHKSPADVEGASRAKRYALGGSKWESKYLNYRLARYSEKLTKDETDTDMYKSLAMWSKVADIDFYKADYDATNVDIDISFMPTSHGDKNFDGRGGVLAHAFYPVSGGDVHMDEAENWSTDSYEGDNFLQVLVHEIGHSLGLDHSGERNAVMYPFAGRYDPDFKLHDDDIQGIQEIYGANPNYDPRSTTPTTTTSTTTTTTTVTPDPPIPCSEVGDFGLVDAATMTEDGTTYMFYGELYMEVDAIGIKPGFPKRIRHRWTDGPDRVDAALSYPAKKKKVPTATLR